MPLLDIVQRACAKLGQPRLGAVVSSPDPQAARFLELANEECEEASARHDWAALKRSGSFTGGALSGGVISYGWPTDFGRLFIDGGLTFQGYDRPVGSTSDATWRSVAVGSMPAAGPFWRVYGAGVQLYGAAPGDTIRFEYISNQLVISSAGVGRTSFQADTDRPAIPERLVRLDIVWRWRQAKGFDYADDLETYEREIERVTSADAGPREISTALSLDLPPLTAPVITVAP